jgi:gluconolactonase
MRIINIFFVTLLFAAIQIVAQSYSIVPQSSEPQKIFDGGFFTEGPAVDSEGNVYFSDQTFTSETNMEAGHIWKYSPKTRKTIIFRSPSGMSNGLEIDKEDNLFVCEGADYGGRRIIKTDLKTGKSKIVTAKFKGKSFNSPNDLVVDSKGQIYFTDPRYVGNEPIEQSCNGVFKIGKNDEVKLLIENISMPNGIALSPDERKLYVGCNDEGDQYDNPKHLLEGMFVAEYNIASSGEVEFSKKLIEFKSDAGPDGITIDSKGNLYVAVRDEANPFIGIYNPEGDLIDKINLPEVPSNVTFGKGKWKNVLYITAGGNLYKIKLNSMGIVK